MLKPARSVARFLTAAFALATLSYYFDPASGRRRRARLSEQSGRALRRLISTTCGAGRDLGNRLAGWIARRRGRLRPSGVEATVLIERVRACLGRIVSHPGAIHVSVTAPQRVLLRGAVLAWEQGPLLRAVAAVPGVRAVQEQLSVHESADHISALQGGRARHAGPWVLRRRWSPGTRLATAAAGGGLLWGGLVRRGALGALSATAGTVLLLRSIWAGPARAGANGLDGSLAVRKSLRIHAPVHRVFETLCDCESFPLLMRNVLAVQRREDGSTHWRIAGPLGVPLEWNAVTTQLEKNRLLAWRTVEDSSFEHSGLARFEAEADGTRLQVHLWYRPPAGRLGHAIAQLLGADPKSELDTDLMRLKTYLETHRPARDAAAARSH